MRIIVNILGIVLVLVALYLYSSARKSIKKEVILKALVAQFVIAFLLVKFPLGRAVVSKVSVDVVTMVLNYGQDGIGFVFGSLANPGNATGFIFAISVLCNIIFLSSLVAALYYLGILGWVVKIIGKGVGKLLGTTQVESFVAVANMFLGQTKVLYLLLNILTL